MAYDGLSRRVAITELHGTTVVTANTDVWCESAVCQERDVTGHTVTKQFFSLGEQINGTNYYLTYDHLGSVREMTDSNGVVHANYDYDLFGRQMKLSGDLDSDFGFTDFGIEKTLCLDLTMYRIYDPEKGRWLSRDPSGEAVGFNLYEYVDNKSAEYTDSLGLVASGSGNSPRGYHGGGGGNNTSTPASCPTNNPNPDNNENVFLNSLKVELGFQIAEKGFEHYGLGGVSESLAPLGWFLFLNDNMNDPGLIPPSVQNNSDCNGPPPGPRHNLPYSP